MVELSDKIKSLFSRFELTFEEGKVYVGLNSMYSSIEIMKIINNNLEEAVDIRYSKLIFNMKSEQYSEKDFSEVLEKNQGSIKLVIMNELTGADVKNQLSETEEEKQSKKIKIEDILDGVFVRRHKEGYKTGGKGGAAYTESEGYIAREVNKAKQVTDYINKLTWDNYKVIASHIVKFDKDDRIIELSHGNAVLKENSTGRHDIYFSGIILQNYDILGLMENNKKSICDIMGKEYPRHISASSIENIKTQNTGKNRVSEDWKNLEM